MSDTGQKILDGLRDAVEGNWAGAYIEGQHWIRAPEWQPIDSAPKRQWVLVAVRLRPRAKKLTVTKAYLETSLGVAEWGEWPDGNPLPIPTHWMPVPNPPELS